MQALESFKTKLDNARRRAEAAEARTPELERLNAEQAEKLEQLQENLRSTRQATITLNHLLPVLQKLRDAQTKLEQRSARADELQVKYDALVASIDELHTQFDGTRRENKELQDMIAELNI
ncbi:hypothetical protein Agabi119p4_6450 [Agaricus bisporus var. burnettii]|uniref:Uncharacterized protein n=1 Tax=Agaricus bisporus var. burnettii TaxID=192524 RepID=A0A8H7C9Y4_AGABI|nr:hypothetical protein Agabi119p4_6450 [Agaricus bisporus var. burnettii]